jgi:hypothetical protein
MDPWLFTSDQMPRQDDARLGSVRRDLLAPRLDRADQPSRVDSSKETKITPRPVRIAVSSSAESASFTVASQGWCEQPHLASGGAAIHAAWDLSPRPNHSTLAHGSLAQVAI